MTMEHDYCPFCGNQHDDDGIFQIVEFGKPEWSEREMWMSYVGCGHCGARGSRFYDEDRESVERPAAQAWRQVKRASWWDRNPARWWRQLRYDLYMLRGRFFD